MVYPTFGTSAQGAASNASPNGGSSATSAITVNRGDSVYVLVAYGCGSGATISVKYPTPGVTDSAGNVYQRIAIKQNGSNSTYPAIEVWCADNVPATSALTISVAFTANTFYIFSAVQISGAYGAGSVDLHTAGDAHSGTSSTDPITTDAPYDLVVACQCDVRGTGTLTSGGGFTMDTGLSGASGGTLGSDVYLQVFYLEAAAAGAYNSSLSWPTAEPFSLITVGIRCSTPWSSVSGRPFVTVSPVGIANSLAAIPNNGADFGPDTPSTATYGIQEALNTIASTGGHIYCLAGKYLLNAPIVFTGSFQRLEFAPGSSIQFANGLTGVQPNWTSSNYQLPYSLVLMGAPETASSPTPFSHQEFVGNGVQINWGSNGTVAGIEIVSPGPQSSSPYTGAGGEDFLIEGVVSTGYISECFGVHAQYQNNSNTIEQMTRHIIVRRFYDTRSAVSTGGSGFAVGGNVFDMLIEDVEIDLSQAYGGTGLSNCFIGGWQGGASNIVVRRCRFISNGGLTGQPQLSQVLELQGNGLLTPPYPPGPPPGNQPTATNGLSDVTLEDCAFDSGASSGNVAAGYGGAYLDDNNTASGSTGPLNRVKFKNCQWINCGMTLQSQYSTPGYVLFDGPMPPMFYDYYGSSVAQLQGRPLLQGPNLSVSGAYGSRVQQTLLTTPGITLAQYSPPVGAIGIFRVDVYLTAKTAGTATVVINWTDPTTGSQFATPINAVAMVANQVVTASQVVVVNSTGVLVVGTVSASGPVILGSAGIVQLG